MKIEDVKIGQTVITRRGNIGTVKKIYRTTQAVEIALMSGGRSLPYCETIEPYTMPKIEEVVRETIEAFTRTI